MGFDLVRHPTLHPSSHTPQEDEEFYLKEVLLGKYARKLLSLKKLRAFVQFGAIVDHDLRSWLVREAARSLSLTGTELPGQLALLHDQFGVPWPKHFEQIKRPPVAIIVGKMSRSRRPTVDESDSTVSPATSTTPRTPRAKMSQSAGPARGRQPNYGGGSPFKRARTNRAGGAYWSPSFEMSSFRQQFGRSSLDLGTKLSLETSLAEVEFVLIMFPSRSH